MTAEAEHKVIISPAGVFEPGLMDSVSAEISRIFGYPVQTAALLDDLEFAYDPGRDQYHSTPILGKLAESAPSHAVKVIAVTSRDLFIPILTHVYGEAQLGGKACIVSTFRLDEGISKAVRRDDFIGRAVKEAIHELGHTFKLLHCKDKRCIMHYCREIRDVDRKSDDLCRYCKVLLDDEIKRLAKTHVSN